MVISFLGFPVGILFNGKKFVSFPLSHTRLIIKMCLQFSCDCVINCQLCTWMIFAGKLQVAPSCFRPSRTHFLHLLFFFCSMSNSLKLIPSHWKSTPDRKQKNIAQNCLNSHADKNNRKIKWKFSPIGKILSDLRKNKFFFIMIFRI